MDAFNSPQDQRSNANESSQAAQQQNANLAALSQPRAQASGLPFWQGWANDDPWTPLYTGASSDVQTRAQLLGSANFQTSYQDYRSKPLLSECDTNPEDSAYGSRLTHSIGNPSTYGEDLDHDVQTLESQNPDTQLVNRNLETLQLQCQPAANDTQLYSDQWTRHRPPASVATAPVGGEKRWPCSDCNKRCRTRSELRKHELKHSLPWVCDVSGCSREKGFTSKNDLDRHKKTVHGDRSVGGRTFVCNIGNCAKKSKFWPRADNFRSHLQRIHSKTYQANDDLSEYVHRPPPSQDLEGIGGSAMAYLQAQEQSPGLAHPSAIFSYREHYGDRRVSQSQIGTNTLPRSSGSISFDRDASGLATVREGDENFIQPDILSGPGPFHPPPHRWQVPAASDEDAPGDDITASESEPQEDSPSQAMGGVQQSETSDTEMSSASGQDLGSHQPDVRMIDADEAQHTPKPMSSQGNSIVDSSSMNPESTFKILDKIPKEVIASYLKTHSTELREETPKPDTTSSKSQGHSHKCPDCEKSFPRLCELKKHRKRHSKPYGCTFADCKKTFGSKNDWKRHESIQHYQLETWTCDCTKPDSTEACGKVCHRRESFRNHLTKEHAILDSSKLEEKVDSCRKGRHCDAHFWCGFCLKTIEIKETDNTWVKRCDHIDDHFSGRGMPKRHISDWVHEDHHKTGISNSRRIGSGSGSSSGSSISDPKSPQRSAMQVATGKNGDDRGPQKEMYMWICCNCNGENSLSHNTLVANRTRRDLNA
ncbi:hypothetical protein FSARC_640 [Fusarium sarcochroum]|uniref:C2H2-type domain-containing protein n=1 Tax=Fusarium sarcochroum TaxID=1208366 RepID=A0A8H4UB94_9HYPO|nr:hypothetical protein FSARC_640 [Fusarium sarcochroum]